MTPHFCFDQTEKYPIKLYNKTIKEGSGSAHYWLFHTENSTAGIIENVFCSFASGLYRDERMQMFYC